MSVLELWLEIRLSAEAVFEDIKEYLYTPSKIPSTQQNHSIAQTRSFPQKKDIKNLKKLGFKVINMRALIQTLCYALSK